MDPRAPLVHVTLLGPVAAAGGGRHERLPDERPTHLLALLALNPGWMPRAQVATLLWPRLAHETALRNLRKTLHRLRRQWWADAVTIEPDRLALHADTDLDACLQHLQAGDAAAALALMRGPLAPELSADGEGGALGWLAQARDHWLGRWRSALLAAVPGLPPARAEAELQRLRAIDPHDEDLARAHLALLARDGRRGEAERVRAEHARRLLEDLGVAPEATTSSACVADAGAATTQPSAPPPPPESDPAPIGRDDELQWLESQLAETGTAIVITGPGGIGKTRLATEAALRRAAAGAAVTWLRLSDLAEPADAWPRLAALLGVELPQSGQGTDAAATTALAAALGRRPSLLVADNCEHLLQPPGTLVARLQALHAAAPSLALLLTSREPPGLPGERLLLLRGLDTAEAADPPGAILRSPSARLFVARALRLEPRLDARAEAAAVGRIARAADGHPLALELAASWIRSQSCSEIADELERGRLPPALGEQDLAAVFARSWTTLPARLQQALQVLATLPASVERATALDVAGLRAAEFAALVDRCLIDRHGARWRLHPLLRAWVQQAHGGSAWLRHETARRSARHMTARLQAQCQEHGHDGPSTLAWIDTELPHLLAAWARAVDEANPEALRTLVPALEAYFELRGRRDEGLRLCTDAIAVLPSTRPARAARVAIDAARASLLFRMGRYDDAQRLATQLRTAAPAVGDWRSLAGAHRVAGLVHWQRGQPEQALREHQRSQALALQHGLDDMLAYATLNIAVIDHYAGRSEAAERGYRQVAEQALRAGSPRLRANALVNIGSLLHPAGRAAEARPLLEEALALVDAEGLRGFRLTVLTNLGAALLELGDLAALAPVLAQARQAIDHGGEASMVYGVELLSLLACLRGGRAQAGWPHAVAALAATTRLGQKPAQAAVAMYCAQLWAATGRRDRAAAWLAFQRAQAEQWDVDRQEANRLWAGLALDEHECRAALALAATLTLDDLRREAAAEAAH